MKKNDATIVGDEDDNANCENERSVCMRAARVHCGRMLECWASYAVLDAIPEIPMHTNYTYNNTNKKNQPLPLNEPAPHENRRA